MKDRENEELTVNCHERTLFSGWYFKPLKALKKSKTLFLRMFTNIDGSRACKFENVSSPSVP